MKKLLIIFLVFACNVKEPVQQIELLSKSTPEAEGISSKAILVLATGHGGNAVIEDDECCSRVVVDHIEQAIDTGVQEG